MAKLRTTHYYLRYPKCPHCGNSVRQEIPACPTCGTPLLVDHYRLVRVIAHTTAGSLFEAIDLRTRMRCAIKRIVAGSGNNGYRIIEDELADMERLRGLPCMPRHIKVVPLESECFLILPAINGVPLSQLVKESWDAAQMMSFLDNGLALVEALHRRRVRLRDLTPDNLIYTSDERLLLIDYGQFTPSRASGFVAPELTANIGYNERTDLYHLGATTYSLLSGGQPPNQHQHQRVVGKNDLPDQFWKVLEELLHRDPDRRPHDAASARSHLCSHNHMQMILIATMIFAAALLGAWFALSSAGVATGSL